MARPSKGDRVFVRSHGKVGTVTSITRRTVRVRFNAGPGRPHEIDIDEIGIRWMSGEDLRDWIKTGGAVVQAGVSLATFLGTGIYLG